MQIGQLQMASTVSKPSFNIRKDAFNTVVCVKTLWIWYCTHTCMGRRQQHKFYSTLLRIWPVCNKHILLLAGTCNIARLFACTSATSVSERPYILLWFLKSQVLIWQTTLTNANVHFSNTLKWLPIELKHTLKEEQIALNFRTPCVLRKACIWKH